MGRKLTSKERMHRAMSERSIQDPFMALARQIGYLVSHHHDSRREVRPGVFVGDRDAKGFPDLILLRPPRLIAVEVKKELGIVTPEQWEWLQGFKAMPCCEAYVLRPSNLDDMRKLIRSTARPEIVD